MMSMTREHVTVIKGRRENETLMWHGIQIILPRDPARREAALRALKLEASDGSRPV